MNEVRWVVQCSRKGSNVWKDREDVTYTGWFYGTGADTPSESLLRDFNEVKEKEDWLDWRLVQENRSFVRKVIA